MVSGSDACACDTVTLNQPHTHPSTHSLITSDCWDCSLRDLACWSHSELSESRSAEMTDFSDCSRSANFVCKTNSGGEAVKRG